MGPLRSYNRLVLRIYPCKQLFTHSVTNSGFQIDLSTTRDISLLALRLYLYKVRANLLGQVSVTKPLGECVFDALFEAEEGPSLGISTIACSQ